MNLTTYEIVIGGTVSYGVDALRLRTELNR